MRHPEDFARAAWRRLARLDERIVPGTVLGDSISIDHLICPLRYDICVRIDFVRLLRDEWTLFQKDFAAFRNRPATAAYYSWFRDIRCARYESTLLRDAGRLDAAFLQRVDQTARLWKSLELKGFDPSQPIRLASGRSLHSVNGKMINETIFSGDGCHRIACLHLLGWDRLEPMHYEVAMRARFTPLDITAVLLDLGLLDRPTYLRYIAQFYGDGLEFESADAIVHYVSYRKPELLSELQSVFSHDLVRIGSHGRLGSHE